MIRPSATSASLDRGKYRKKKALIPPTIRNSGTHPSNSSTMPSFNSASTGSLPKTNIIPPAFRHAESSQSTTPRSRTPCSTSSTSKYCGHTQQQKVTPVQQRSSWTSSSNTPPIIDKEITDVAKSLAKTDFSRLILEQNTHINEQTATLNNLSQELEKLEPSYTQMASVNLDDVQVRKLFKFNSFISPGEEKSEH